MKFRVLMLLAAVLIAGPAFAQKIYIDYDKEYDGSKNKTFAWGSEEATLAEVDPFLHAKILETLKGYITESGVTEVDSDPDVYVTYHGSSKDEMSVNTTSMGVGYPSIRTTTTATPSALPAQKPGRGSGRSSASPAVSIQDRSVKRPPHLRRARMLAVGPPRELCLRTRRQNEPSPQPILVNEKRISANRLVAAAIQKLVVGGLKAAYRYSSTCAMSCACA